jgi:Tn3 transposase DDE domain
MLSRERLLDDIDGVIHSSSDGQKFETERPTVKAQHSPKYFGKGKGVVVATLVANHVPLHAELISAHDHESQWVFDLLYNNPTSRSPERVCHRAGYRRVDLLAGAATQGPGGAVRQRGTARAAGAVSAGSQCIKHGGGGRSARVDATRLAESVLLGQARPLRRVTSLLISRSQTTELATSVQRSQSPALSPTVANARCRNGM